MLFPSHPRLSALILLTCTACEAAPLTTPRLSCEVENTARTTILTASVKGNDAKTRFRIDWHTGDETTENFTDRPMENSARICTYRLGKTTVTRTILASAEADCIFIHVRADQPGPVGFTAKFTSEGTATIENRREIAFAEKDIHARAWILPFESDVADDGKATLTLTGEGEALVILNLTADPEARPIAGTLRRLGKKHDPGQPHPNPHLIWEGVRKHPPEALPAMEPRF